MAKIPDIEISVVYDFSDLKTDSEENFIIKAIPMFPHCDSRVLHRPFVCKYCDENPQWQSTGGQATDQTVYKMRSVVESVALFVALTVPPILFAFFLYLCVKYS